MDYMPVGNNELGEEITEVRCKRCGEIHPIEYGKSRELTKNGWTEWKPNSHVGFYQCGGNTYIASINGKAVPARAGDAAE